jgi:tryptophan synthase alpha chain
MIRFLAPTTDDERLKVVLDGATGYLYYASIAGITGTKSYAESDVRASVLRIRRATDLPCVVGFGIKTPEQAGVIAGIADGAVVGSAIVTRIEKSATAGVGRAGLVSDVLEFCASLAKSVHAAPSASVLG